MAIISKARELRHRLQLQEGRNIPMMEVARLSGVNRKALARLEDGETERFDGEILDKLCAFYGVGVGDILEYVAEAQQEETLSEQQEGTVSSES